MSIVENFIKLLSYKKACRSDVQTNKTMRPKIRIDTDDVDISLNGTGGFWKEIQISRYVPNTDKPWVVNRIHEGREQASDTLSQEEFDSAITHYKVSESDLKKIECIKGLKK